MISHNAQSLVRIESLSIKLSFYSYSPGSVCQKVHEGYQANRDILHCQIRKYSSKYPHVFKKTATKVSTVLCVFGLSQLRKPIRTILVPRICILISKSLTNFVFSECMYGILIYKCGRNNISLLYEFLQGKDPPSGATIFDRISSFQCLFHTDVFYQ